MNLTEHEEKIFNSIFEKCKLNKWYDLDPKRNDYEKVKSALIKFIEVWGLLEFRDTTYSQYRLIERRNVVELYMIENNLIFDSNIHQLSGVKTSPAVKIERKKTSFKVSTPGVCSRPDLVNELKPKNDSSRIITNIIDKEKSREVFRNWLEQ